MDDDLACPPHRQLTQQARAPDRSAGQLGKESAVRVIERDHGLVAVDSPGRRQAAPGGQAQSRG
jgi:hypothetical protein